MVVHGLRLADGCRLVGHGSVKSGHIGGLPGTSIFCESSEFRLTLKLLIPSHFSGMNCVVHVTQWFLKVINASLSKVAARHGRCDTENEADEQSFERVHV